MWKSGYGKGSSLGTWVPAEIPKGRQGGSKVPQWRVRSSKLKIGLIPKLSGRSSTYALDPNFWIIWQGIIFMTQAWNFLPEFLGNHWSRNTGHNKITYHKIHSFTTHTSRKLTTVITQSNFASNLSMQDMNMLWKCGCRLWYLGIRWKGNEVNRGVMGVTTDNLKRTLTCGPIDCIFICKLNKW